MNQTLKTVLISSLVFILGVTFFPLSWLDIGVGTVSLTTISGSNNLSDFPTTYNANLSALNDGKVDVASTTWDQLTTASNLVTVGTITSGTWQGTGVAIGYGGTGSTTYPQYELLFGSSTNPVWAGIGIGTSGQLLTSNGAGQAPSWQSSSFDTGANYTLTGLWNFNTATTSIRFLAASSTVYFNGVRNDFPATQGASSTVLKNNGSGVLVWDNMDWQEIAYGELTGSATSLSVSSIPAREYLRVLIYDGGKGGSDRSTVRFNGSSAADYGSAVNINDGAASTDTSNGDEMMLHAIDSTAVGWYEIIIHNPKNKLKTMTAHGIYGVSGSAAPDYFDGAYTWNNTTAQINQITLTTNGGAQSFNASTSIMVYGSIDER